MARAKGSAKFSGNLEVAAGGPLDARTVVSTIGELTVASNFPYSYVGMHVSVQDEGKMYLLIAKPVTDLDNWREVGSGGGSDNIVEGYYNNADHLFYKENTFETPIEGVSKTLYIDLPTNTSYRYTGTIFVRIDEEYGPAYVIEGYRNDADGLFYRELAFENAITGVSGVIYVALNENQTYRWAGAAFARLDKEHPEIIFGYYNDSDELFYEEAAFTNLITGATDKIYVGLNVNKTFRYNGVAFVRLDNEESGSGSTQKVITSSVDLGGIEKNDSFPIGTNYDDMWDQLLNPLITPVLTDPSASLSYSLDNNGYYKVGATVTARAATLTYNAGSITLDGVKQNDRGGAATGYSIATTGADTEYSDSSDSSGSFTIPALTRATKGTIKITGTVSYAAGPQPKDSKGNNYSTPLAAGSKSADKTLNFIQPYYYGVSNNGTISDFTGLTEAISTKGNKTYSFTTNNQYMVFAYDSSYGNLKNILDPNSFETISGWNKSTVTVNGFSYYVYVSKSPTTDSNAAFTFKY